MNSLIFVLVDSIHSTSSTSSVGYQKDSYGESQPVYVSEEVAKKAEVVK